jgi:putative multiple sugar transport system ATP-binding protein
MEYILELKQITKVFPGTKALDSVDLKVRVGEIHALVGENGAGKSTLMKVVCGIYPHGSYEGVIEYKGQVREYRNVRQSADDRIVIVHQELELVPDLPIFENIFLGNERGRFGIINQSESILQATKLMETVGLKESPMTLIKDIGVGKQQLVEIAKALSQDVELLILDEPTAALNDEESEDLLKLLIAFKKRGITCILISHKLEELSMVADAMTIMRDGKTVDYFQDGIRNLSHDTIIKSMVNRELTDRFPVRDVKIGDIMYEVKNWNAYHPIHEDRRVLKNVNIRLRAGEVVGLVGLMGAGRTEFAMSLFGRSYGSKVEGEVYKNGKRISVDTIKAAIKNGISYITEDRKRYGLVLINDIICNTTLAALDRVSKIGVINHNEEIKEATRKKNELQIKTPNVTQIVGNLSGGNQQKVVLAKWIFTNPDLLILDEPTRGIDISAKHEIYSIINDLSRQGKCILMISSEMNEILGMCDRIYVMAEGRIKGELPKEEATQEAIMKCIILSNERG